ncbi:MAG: hypothetical protein CVV64_08945 [Candidatus Wallbacteria bacterium HGW-Wallbacteria-1]|uniref:Uncharacterized protein n=1 Tax=Candidatus Wallbacteria bacterium HGW-Wallbacteria-1 TaxID=2013854 RepID=A0A2N1PQ69_9BACT|nr:MAG: hypothetical protein CVV64_08945 [Candidatus Wallbacteria bacterium HGW-Wallbacteria-1]
MKPKQKKTDPDTAFNENHLMSRRITHQSSYLRSYSLGRRSQGYSLMEILIVLGIVSLMSVMMANMFSSGSRLFATGTWNQIQLTKCNVAMRKLMGEIVRASNENEARMGTVVVGSITYDLPQVETRHRNFTYEATTTAQGSSVENKIFTFEINQMDTDATFSTTIETIVCNGYMKDDTLFFEKEKYDSTGVTTLEPRHEILDQIDRLEISHDPILDSMSRESRAMLNLKFILRNPKNTNNNFQVQRSCTINVKAACVSEVAASYRP